jgi:hypothetical protein
MRELSFRGLFSDRPALQSVSVVDKLIYNPHAVDLTHIANPVTRGDFVSGIVSLLHGHEREEKQCVEKSRDPKSVEDLEEK